MIGQAGLEPFFASHAHPYPNHYLNIVGATRKGYVDQDN
jgi:hypothetical protein